MSAFTNVIVRISKTKTKRLTVGKKIGEKFNLSCLFMNIFRSFLRFSVEADVVVALGPKKEMYLLAEKFPSRCPPCCFFFNVWLQSALRSFAIVCDYMETALFAIVCDLRSAIVCDRLRSYGNQP